MKKIFKKILFIFIIFTLSGCTKKNVEEKIVIVNNKIVLASEYKVYLYEQKENFEEIGGKEIWQVDFDGSSSEEIAKINALNSVVHMKIAIIKSEEKNISLEASEEGQILEMVSNFKNNIGAENIEKINIENNQLENIMKENLIYKKLYHDVTKNIIINNQEFEKYYNFYIEDNKEIFVNYIYLDKSDFKTEEEFNSKINEIYKNINSENFEEYIEEYSKEEMTTEEISDFFLEQEDLEKIKELKENEISEIIIGNIGAYIFKINKIEQKENFDENIIKEMYLNNKKEEFFIEEHKRWQENSKIEVNNEALEKISIKEFLD